MAQLDDICIIIWIFVFLEKRSQVTLWEMIHVLATALVTQRISEEISGAGVLIASKVAIGDLSFLFPGWRCPPADCQLPLRQEGAECCTCSCSSLHSTLLCFLLPSSNLSFPPHNSSTFTLVPTSFTFPPGIGTDAIMGLFRNRWHRSHFRARYKKIQCRPGPSSHSSCTFQRLCQSTAIRRQSIENLLTQILKFHSEATGKIS